MEVNVNPELESKLCALAAKSGRQTDELFEDALAGYFDEVAGTRTLLDKRYDDLKSGEVNAISVDQVEAYFSSKDASASN